MVVYDAWQTPFNRLPVPSGAGQTGPPPRPFWAAKRGGILAVRAPVARHAVLRDDGRPGGISTCCNTSAGRSNSFNFPPQSGQR